MYRKTFIALLDQAMLSALNMAIALFFIKFSSKSEYGEYSLAFAVILFASGFHNTLIHLPLTVTGNKIDQKDRTVFFGSLFILFYAILMLISAIAALFLLVAPQSLMLNPITCWILLFSISGILSRELIRSLFFADLKVVYVFLMDIIYAFLLALLLGNLYYFDCLTASNVIAIMGISSLVAALFFMKPVLVNIHLPERWRDFHKNVHFSWQDSRWMVAGMIVGWIINNGYLFILAYLVSKESVAELNGTRVLLAPLVIIIGAWGKVFIPKGSSMVFSKMYRQVLGIFVKSTLGLLALACGYITILFMVHEFLESHLYNGKYYYVGTYIVLWGGFVLITIICSNLQNLISLFSRFKELFYFGFVNSLLFLFLSYFLIVNFGGMGAIWALIVAKLILSLQYGGYYLTKRNTVFLD